MTASVDCAAGAAVEELGFRVQSDAVSNHDHFAVAERDCSGADVEDPQFVTAVAVAAEADAGVQKIVVTARQEASEEAVFVAAAAVRGVAIANGAALATADVQVRVLVQGVAIVVVPPQARAYVVAPAKFDDAPDPAYADHALSPWDPHTIGEPLFVATGKALTCIVLPAGADVFHA